jgi:hypothetical protein
VRADPASCREWPASRRAHGPTSAPATAISEFNRLTNIDVAACLASSEPRPQLSEWLCDLNIAAYTIRALFSDGAYQAAKKVSDMVTPYATWDALSVADKKKRADKFSDVCHEALTALYREVFPLKKSIGADTS